jgi:2-polyprenyl-3-methyl-5-hydroxy-6-metoxy-1,4-benzoquinol methylase
MGTVQTIDSVRLLRTRIFAKDWPLDEQIRDAARSVPSHHFLVNPSGQYSYIYLTQFVREMAEKYFHVPFAQLDVLDWGCGKGHVSKLLRDLGPKHVESCDILSAADDSTFGQAVPIIRNFNIPVTPLTHEYILPYEAASFDVVLSVGVLEHVSNEAASLAEIARVLKPGALLFCFFLPTRLSWTQLLSRWSGDTYHNRLYTEGHIREMLSAAGLQLLNSWYRQLLPKNSVHYPKFRLFEKLDLFMTENTPLRYFATNLEFVSFKPHAK